jgi:hypothetical protein
VISEDTVQAAMEARSCFQRQAAWFLVHFDVDVIDFPAADVLQPQKRDARLSLQWTVVGKRDERSA